MPILPTTKPVWGLDIGASAIKGVRMQAAGDRVQILGADILPFEGDPPAAESMGRDRRIWQALRRFQAKYRVSADRVAVGLPGAAFFTRPFNLFFVGDKTEAELVRFELEQHIPFGLDAVVWDHEIFEPADMSEREREGLLFAMKKDVLNNYMLSLAAARIEPAQIQAAPLALYNFVRYELNPEDPLLVADIGAAGTNIVAIDGGRYWVRTINIGGEMMTGAVRGGFRPRDVDHETAELIKTSVARLTRRAEVVERVTPSLRAFVGETRNAVKHLSQEHKVAFRRLLLLGGASRMHGLQRLLTEELGMSVFTPAGLGRIEIAHRGQATYINEMLPELATAIGLGLQGLGRAATRVNMVTATLAERRNQNMARRTSAIALAAALILVICYAAFASWRGAVYAYGVQKMRGILTPISSRQVAARKATTPGEAESQLATFENMAAGRGVWLMVLDKVSRMLPDNEKSSVPANEKMWLVRLALRARPGTPGVYEGEIEAGTRIRPDGSHLQFAEKVLKVPLEGDPRGIFRNVREIEASRRSPTLSFAGGQGPERYFLVRLRFEVLPGKGGGS